MSVTDRTPSSHLLTLLTITAFYLSAVYAVLLWSPNVLGKYFSRTVVTILFLLPWVMLWLLKGTEFINDNKQRPELFLIMAIIALGIINVIFSDNPNKTYNAMRMFLLSGIMALWISMFLLTNSRAVKTFDWFCCLCIAIIVPTEILTYFSDSQANPNSITIFALNPIPLGTLLLLLSPGPVRLLMSGQKWPLTAGWILTGLGLSLLLLTEKRGTFLALIAIGCAWLFFKNSRLKLTLSILLILIALIVPFKGLSYYRSLDQKNLSHLNILHRLELYPFGLHVYLKHPFFGIGLRPFTHETYLSDYRIKQDLNLFTYMVKDLQTFDNMLLTALVELGSLMTLTYLALIVLIVGKYWRKLQPLAQSPPLNLYRVLVLLGFAVHSMTYDSLLFPSVNWLFHVQLGILAGYTPATDTGLGLASSR